MIYEVIVTLFVLFFSYFIPLYVKSLIKFQAFRGPYALPVIGNFYNPKVFALFRWIASLRREYGKLFVVHLFTKVYLVVVEPTVVRRSKYIIDYYMCKYDH